MSEEGRTAKGEITRLLAVISAGGVSAFVIAVVLVYFYGPSGLYSAKQALLEPEMVQGLRYRDVDSATDARNYYIFDHIEFTYYDHALNRWKSEQVSLERYRRFYQEISSDVSIGDVTEGVIEQFSGGYSAMIKIIVQSEARRSMATKSFQEVTLSYQGDYYRIELREEKKNERWAYFFHKDIYKKAFDILK